MRESNNKKRDDLSKAEPSLLAELTSSLAKTILFLLLALAILAVIVDVLFKWPLKAITTILPISYWSAVPLLLASALLVKLFITYWSRYYHTGRTFTLASNQRRTELLFVAGVLLYPAILGVLGTFKKINETTRHNILQKQQQARVESLERKRTSIKEALPTLTKQVASLMKEGRYSEADFIAQDILFAYPDNPEIVRLSAKIARGLEKQGKDLAKQKEKEIQAKREKERQAASILQAKKSKIKNLADQFATTLPSLLGHEELLKTVSGNYRSMPCTEAYHTHAIKWLNEEKTRARVTVTLHGKYLWHVWNNGRMSYETRDYKGGTFTCEESADGEWKRTATN
ncbi:MAG TPA: hypothetical protein DCY27_04595 [Desulfobacterales bacterium]|nr:hypothetical protein [Desulfobacterales bacterium]